MPELLELNINVELLKNYKITEKQIENLEKSIFEINEVTKDKKNQLNNIILFCLEYFELYYQIYEGLPGQKNSSVDEYEKLIHPIKKIY